MSFPPILNPAVPRTSDGTCALCLGSGWVVQHRQGDPVANAPGWTHGSTVQAQCECRFIVIDTGKSFPT